MCVFFFIGLRLFICLLLLLLATAVSRSHFYFRSPQVLRNFLLQLPVMAIILNDMNTNVYTKMHILHTEASFRKCVWLVYFCVVVAFKCNTWENLRFFVVVERGCRYFNNLNLAAKKKTEIDGMRESGRAAIY